MAIPEEPLTENEFEEPEEGAEFKPEFEATEHFADSVKGGGQGPRLG